MIRPLTVTTPNDTDILVTRTFEAPRALVWRAMTEPELLRRWHYAPDGWSMTECTVDLRVGGRYRWVWAADDGSQMMAISGEYLEITAPARLQATEQFDDPWYGADPAVDTSVFTEIDGVTTMELTVHYASREARDMALSTPMADGMERGYARLDEWLAEQAAPATQG